jgi:quinol monooxygenase YgiN
MSTTAQVVVTAIVLVKPGAQDQALESLTTAITATHGEEGCLGYALHRDLADPARFVIVEQWATPEALQEHATLPHLKQLFADLGPLLAEPPTILRTAPEPVGDAAKGVL